MSFNAPVGFADQALDDYNFAVGLYKQQRWRSAANTLQQFLNNHPGHVRVPYAKLYLGLSLVNLREFEDARKVLRDFVKTYPDNKNVPHAVYRIAECSYLLDDLKAAEADLTAFVEGYPDDPLLERALPYLGDVQLRLSKPELAAASFQKSLERFPQGNLAEDSRFGLARSYEAAGQIPEATRIYEMLAADTKGMRSAEAQMNLGAISFQAGQFSQAASRYEALLSRFPKCPQVPRAHLNAGYAYYNNDQMKEAIPHFERAADEPTLARTSRFWQALSLKSLGDYPKAIGAFELAYRVGTDHPETERILYEWGQTLRQTGRNDSALERFLEIVDGWPKSELADDSLHAAALCAFEAGNLDKAELLLDRFDREYSESGLRMHHVLLRGRVLFGRGRYDDAAASFRKVLSESEIARTRDRGRYYLATTLQSMAHDVEAIDVIAPLVEQVEKEGANSEFVDALIVQAKGFLATKQYEPCFKVASRYLDLKPDGDGAAEALSIRAIALAREGKKIDAQSDLSTLSREHPESPILLQTLYGIADIAYDAHDWQWSEDLFQSVIDLGTRSSYYIPALSGLAWCEHKQSKFQEAAEHFGRIVQENPEHELAPEAGFMRGQSLEDAQDLEKAAAAYQAAYSAHGKSRFAYLARLQEARILGRLLKFDAADAAYDKLLENLPDPERRDKLLEEWAVLHYEAGRYDRADEIFKRLVRETPESDRADNAQLILAESDLTAGRVSTAEKTFQELAESPNSDQQVRELSLYHLLNILAEHKDWKRLSESAMQFWQRFPESPKRWYARFQYGESQLQMSAIESAVQTLEQLKAEKNDPSVSSQEWFPRVFVLLAEAAFQRRQYSEVASVIAEFRSWKPESSLLYQAEEVLGRSYKNQAKFDEARETFERVIQDPAGEGTITAAKCQLMVAETYFMQKEYEKALAAYLRVHILYQFREYQAPALFQAAQCHEALNQWSDAVKTYQMLLKQFPESEFSRKAAKRLESALKRSSD